MREGVAKRAHRHARDRAGTIAAIALTIGLGYAPVVRAGDMDALGYVFVLFGVFCVLVVALAGAAIYACRKISDARLRAMARLLIVVILFNPIPVRHNQDRSRVELAFLLMVQQSGVFGVARETFPSGGLFSHPILLADTIVMSLFTPLVLVWAKRKRSA